MARKKRVAKKKAVRKNPSGSLQAMVKRDLNRYKKAGYLMTAAKRQVKALRRGANWARIVDVVAADMVWKAPKKKVTMQKPTAVVDHMIVADMREAKETAARQKGLKFDKRLYFDGGGWSKSAGNAARYHNRTHAVKIAQLLADSGSNNDSLRQLAVIEENGRPK
jgi:hypothetical protein